MIRLDAATVLLQWATGGLLFLWVTTRRREVGVGYGWLMRASFGGIAAIGVARVFGWGVGDLSLPVYVLAACWAALLTAATLARKKHRGY